MRTPPARSDDGSPRLVLRGEEPAWLLTIGGTLAVAALAAALGDEPAEQFGEGGLGTWASCLLLLASAAAAFQTWAARRDPGRRGGPAVLWLLIASAFVYLALDDALSWHEKIDRFVHRKVLGAAATNLTKHLDDLIIGVYGLFAVCILYRFRDELRRVPALRRVLTLAMGLMFGQVVLDGLDHPHVLEALAEKGRGRRLLRTWTPVVEETTKLVAESIFLLGFLRARRHARRAPC